MPSHGRLRYRTAFWQIICLACTSPLWLLSCHAQHEVRYESPTIRRLSESLAAGDSESLQRFWAQASVPLFEPIEDQPEFDWITFVWRGDSNTRRVSIGVGDIPTINPSKWQFQQLGSSNLWFKTDRVPSDVRFTYMLRVNDGDLQLDPLNPRRFAGRSAAEAPDAPTQTWAKERNEVPRGELTHHKFRSQVLQEERSFGVYTPAGYATRTTPLPLLVVFDGEVYGNAADAPVPTATILDNLIDAKKVPPISAVLVDNMNQAARDRDLKCSRSFQRFLTDELLPWVRERYGVSKRAADVILAGSSDGGLCALCTAESSPNVFGAVLSQSANLSYSPLAKPALNVFTRESGWITRQFVLAPRTPLRFYLEVGLLEAGVVNPVAEHRRLRDVLEAKGYQVTYSEYSGGHDYLNWRGSLASGLIALLGSRSNQIQH